MSEKFVKTVGENPGSIVGMSALLTTTMMQMSSINQAIKGKYPDTKVFVGGAPLSQKYSDEIGTDGYFPDPNKFSKYLDAID